MDTAIIEDAAHLYIAISYGSFTAYTLKAGTYAGDFIVTRSGTAEVPVVISAEAGAIIDGSLIINGDYITLQNVEIYYSGWTTRETLETGSFPTDIPAKDLTVNGKGVQLINCIIHDLRGVGLWAQAQGSTFYGCLIYHIGWSAPDRGHGHSLYTQNDTPERIIKHNVLGKSFGYSLHAYTEGATINNLTFNENVCLMSRIVVGGYVVAQNPKLLGMATYSTGAINLGYHAGVTGGILTDNYLPDGIEKNNCVIVSETGNFYGPTPASGQRVTVYPNDFQTGRGLITVYNWDNADSIAVDVSSVLAAGTGYQIRNVQDYFVDIATGTVAGDGTITIDMRAISHTVAAVVGGWPSEPTTFPTFGCFVIEAI